MNDLKIGIPIQEKVRRQKTEMFLKLSKFTRLNVYGIHVQRMLILSVSEDGMQLHPAATYAYLYLKGYLTSNIQTLRTFFVVLT